MPESIDLDRVATKDLQAELSKREGCKSLSCGLTDTVVVLVNGMPAMEHHGPLTATLNWD